MKKTFILCVITLMFIGFLNAQEVFTNKQGVPVLPKAGEFAIGINAHPILEFVGNSANGSTWNGTSFDFLDNNHYIFGKYFADDLTAYRIMLRVGLNNNTLSKYVTDDLDTEMIDQVIDQHNTSKTNIFLGLGMEKRKGIYRIQGYAGGDLMLGISNGSEKYTYGNEITSTNPMPTTYDFGTNIMGMSRVLQHNHGFGFSVGARAFVGVEYFLFPKLSLGGEFGWGINFGARGTSSVKAEYYTSSGTKSDAEEIEWNIDKSSHFYIDTDNLGGLIKLMFHF